MFIFTLHLYWQDEYLNEGKFDEDLFASAKSTALFEVVENEQSPAGVVKRSLINYLQREGETYNRWVFVFVLYIEILFGFFYKRRLPQF